MSHARIILNGTLSGGVRMAVSLLVVVGLTPKIIHTLGKEPFGLWVLIFSILGLFEWLDLGFFPAIVKYVAQSGALRDVARRNRILSTILASYQLLALAGTLVLAGIGLYFDRLFEIPAALHRDALVVLAILSVRSVVLGLPLAIFRGILFGEQHMALLNLNMAAFSFVYGASGWIALHRGGGLTGLALANLGAFLAESAVFRWFCYRLVPGLELSWSLVDVGVIAEISGLNVTQVVANTSSLLVQKAGPVIVQVGLGLAFVSLYTVPLRIMAYLYMLLKQFTSSLSPVIVHLEASGQLEKLRGLIVMSMKLATALATTMLVSMVLFGDRLIVLWIGEGFRASFPVLAVLAAAMWIAAPEIVGSEVLVMTGHHALLIRYFALQVIVNVGLSIALVRPLGTIGVALGTLLSALVVTLLVVDRTCAIYGISRARCMRECVMLLAVPALGDVATGLALAGLAPPRSLALLILENVPGALVFAALFWWLSASATDRAVIQRALGRGERPVGG